MKFAFQLVSQMLHVMHNLLEAASKDTTVVLTDEEKEFGQRIEELESKLFTKTKTLVRFCSTNLRPVC